MKITELLEAQGEPGQGGKFRQGAYYAPYYDENKKMMVGSVLDWLAANQISKADVAEAITRIKQDQIIEDMAEAGIKLVAKPVAEKRGTLTFEVLRDPQGKKPYTTQYHVFANGAIRYSGTGSFGNTFQTRLQGPRPRVRADDKVGSLVLIYARALEELLRKWEKSSKQKA